MSKFTNDDMGQLMLALAFSHINGIVKTLEKLTQPHAAVINVLREEVFIMACWSIDFALFCALGNEGRTQICDSFQLAIADAAPLIKDKVHSGLVAYGMHGRAHVTINSVDAYVNAAADDLPHDWWALEGPA